MVKHNNWSWSVALMLHHNLYMEEYKPLWIKSSNYNHKRQKTLYNVDNFDSNTVAWLKLKWTKSSMLFLSTDYLLELPSLFRLPVTFNYSGADWTYITPTWKPSSRVFSSVVKYDRNLVLRVFQIVLRAEHLLGDQVSH